MLVISVFLFAMILCGCTYKAWMPVELGATEDELVDKKGSPVAAEQYLDAEGRRCTVLYYKTMEYSSVVTTAFYFVDSKLVEQRVVKDETVKRHTHGDDGRDSEDAAETDGFRFSI